MFKRKYKIESEIWRNEKKFFIFHNKFFIWTNFINSSYGYFLEKNGFNLKCRHITGGKYKEWNFSSFEDAQKALLLIKTELKKLEKKKIIEKKKIENLEKENLTSVTYSQEELDKLVLVKDILE